MTSFQHSPITQKSIFPKSSTWFTSYTHVDYIDFFSFFQLQIRTSYSACRRSPLIQHASGELLQCHHFPANIFCNILNTRFTSVDYIPIFTGVIQFDSYNKIEYMLNNYSKYYFSIDFPYAQKKLSKKRFF